MFLQLRVFLGLVDSLGSWHIPGSFLHIIDERSEEKLGQTFNSNSLAESYFRHNSLAGAAWSRTSTAPHAASEEPSPLPSRCLVGQPRSVSMLWPLTSARSVRWAMSVLDRHNRPVLKTIVHNTKRLSNSQPSHVRAKCDIRWITWAWCTTNGKRAKNSTYTSIWQTGVKRVISSGEI